MAAASSLDVFAHNIEMVGRQALLDAKTSALTTLAVSGLDILAHKVETVDRQQVSTA